MKRSALIQYAAASLAARVAMQMYGPGVTYDLACTAEARAWRRLPAHVRRTIKDPSPDGGKPR